MIGRLRHCAWQYREATTWAVLVATAIVVLEVVNRGTL